jgi:hypothetical protein
MRSHSKLLLIVSFIVANPIFSSVAWGDTARSLSVSEIESAFGGLEADGSKNFGIKSQDGQITLLGFAAESCVSGATPAIKISCDGASGVLEVTYDKSADKDGACLKPAADGVSTTSLPNVTGANCKLTGDFDKLQVRTLKKNGDEVLVEVKNTKGESIANVSEAKRKLAEDEKKKKELENKAKLAKLRENAQIAMLDHCLGAEGEGAADASQDLLDAAKGIKGFVESREKENPGWLEKIQNKITEKRVAGWKNVFTSGSIKDFPKKLAKIAKRVEDGKMEESEAIELYEIAMARLVKATASNGKELAAIDKAHEELVLAMGEKADEEENDLDEKLRSMEPEYQRAQLARATALGAGKDFDAADAKFRDYLVQNDLNSCMIQDPKAVDPNGASLYGRIDVRRRGDPRCAGARRMDALHMQSIGQATAIAKEFEFQGNLQACQSNEIAGLPRSKECTAVFAEQKKRDEAAKLAAGGSSSSTDANASVGDGSGTGSTTTAATKTNEASTNTSTGSNTASVVNANTNRTLFNEAPKTTTPPPARHVGRG